MFEYVLYFVSLLRVGHEDPRDEVVGVTLGGRGGGLGGSLKVPFHRILNQDHHLLSPVKRHILGRKKGVAPKEKHEEDDAARPYVDRLPLISPSVYVEEDLGGGEESSANLRGGEGGGGGAGLVGLVGLDDA